MSLDQVRDLLPDYAKDTRLNLSSLVNSSPLSEQQLWGGIVAAAAASAPSPAVPLIYEAAKEHLSEEAQNAAMAAASVMAMNNVYYRAKHLLSEMGVTSYDNVPPRLRMQVIGNHGGVAKSDFELWCMVVSAINGCGSCLVAHEQELRKVDMPTEQIHEGLRIASVVKATCATATAAQRVALAEG